MSAPIINSTLSVSANIGEYFEYTITASNSPTSYNATNLPVGFSINNDSGLIKGVPSIAGSYSIDLFATNVDGTDSQTLTLNIQVKDSILNLSTNIIQTVSSPDAQISIIDITKNTKGFKVNIKPKKNIDDIKYYNVYLDNINFNLKPNTNDSSLLIKQLPYSELEQTFDYIPRNSGLHYLTIFSKNSLGYESSGILFSGIIPNQQVIKEISFKNFNYYKNDKNDTDDALIGEMNIFPSSGQITVNTPFSLIGFEIDYLSETTEEVANFEGFYLKDFSSYFKEKALNVYCRVIQALDNNSGILFDNTLLRNTSNDVFTFQQKGDSVIKDSYKNDLSIRNTDLIADNQNRSIIPSNSRYFIFDYINNHNAFISKNTRYEEAVNSQNNLLFNPEKDTESSFLQKMLNATGLTGELNKNYILTTNPGHYNTYYISVELTDENGFSSAGGNVESPSNTDLERYTNQDGYKIIKIEHNTISRNKVSNMFKNYRREDNKIVFDIKGDLPIDIGLNSILIIPQKYQENINLQENKTYFDDYIFLRNIDDIKAQNEKNYKIEMIDSQNESKYRITTYLNPDSPLLKDNIFSAKIYYLNSLQAHSLSFYLSENGYTLKALLYYISNTEVIDKYIVLNKFIKDNQNYTSTIAASYQGLVYFFTPESFPYIAWPDQKYRENYLNKHGARMLDFEADGVASGPEFFDYFPKANAEIYDNFPSEIQYKTTYRCLDSYKYSSNNLLEFLTPEDVPTNGINGSSSYLGVYDPGNIGDVDSPNTADFKSINNDLVYFKSKNISYIKFISAGMQKDDAYAIIEFILDIPDAQDFIVQGISGTDTILEKGIKEINGVNHHYFVAKFVSSCGVDTDPILNGTPINQKNIVDSKKMISFLIYPTKIKIIEDPDDVPFFGDLYLLATSFDNNQFSILKECPYTVLNNSTDCVKSCCVQPEDTINQKSIFANFHILSRHIGNQTGNNYPYGKIGGTTNNVLGSIAYRYKAANYSTSNITLEYKKPTNQINPLNFGIVCYPEHNVALDKILIYMKQVNDVNNITWQSADLIDSYIFEDIVKTYPIYLSIPDFTFSKKGPYLFNQIKRDYEAWVIGQKTFAVKILLLDKSGDTLSQIFTFTNNENC